MGVSEEFETAPSDFETLNGARVFVPYVRQIFTNTPDETIFAGIHEAQAFHARSRLRRQRQAAAQPREGFGFPALRAQDSPAANVAIVGNDGMIGDIFRIGRGVAARVQAPGGWGVISASGSFHFESNN